MPQFCPVTEDFQKSSQVLLPPSDAVLSLATVLHRCLSSWAGLHDFGGRSLVLECAYILELSLTSSCSLTAGGISQLSQLYTCPGDWS